MIYVLITEGMDVKQRDELDETLAGMDRSTSRAQRLEYIRGLGGEVVMAKGG